MTLRGKNPHRHFLIPEKTLWLLSHLSKFLPMAFLPATVEIMNVALSDLILHFPNSRILLLGSTLWGRISSYTLDHFPTSKLGLSSHHFSLSCIGEGNGNPLQCSCLENPRDGGAWWTAVYGVTQSWTRLKWLSSSSSNSSHQPITLLSEMVKSIFAIFP